MTTPTRIGPAVIQAVERLEQIGQACYSAGRPPKGSEPREAATKHLRRAVQYGLATRSPEKPYVYRANPDWRAALNPMRVECGRVASVWDFASTNAP
jgi:hypothetical protein